MQRNGVIQPSQSPWSSPVVLVKKKDGSQRFCVDYRELNSVTKVDMFPLRRIDNLLDQLGESKYFSTLDLASGFWQIPVHPNSREKTAFVTPNGLFEFRVLSFGLCNSPAVFQRLMQRVLMGLNPPEAPGFVSVYIDDDIDDDSQVPATCVERFNRTLKAMIRKYAAQFDDQWDRYLPGLLWAYRNTPHESTGEKPSYLLFGIDCRTPTEAALLPPSHIEPTELSSYREEMILSLSTARNAAAKRIQKSQKKNKDYYDRRATHTSYRLGDWILIRFPAEETGARRKLSRPWHEPYRVISKNGPDVTATKVYFPTESQIQVHMSRTCACPPVRERDLDALLNGLRN